MSKLVDEVLEITEKIPDDLLDGIYLQAKQLAEQLKEKDAQLTKISIESIKSGAVHKVQVDDFEKENTELKEKLKDKAIGFIKALRVDNIADLDLEIKEKDKRLALAENIISEYASHKPHCASLHKQNAVCDCGFTYDLKQYKQ